MANKVLHSRTFGHLQILLWRTVVENLADAVLAQRGMVIVGGDRSVMVAEALDHCGYARAAGESVVVRAADHATVDAIAARARAVRVAAGEVEPDGVSAGTAVVGVGDEIVTTRNDRRLAATVLT